MRKWIFKVNVALVCICAILVIIAAIRDQSIFMIVIASIVTVSAMAITLLYFKFVAGKTDT